MGVGQSKKKKQPAAPPPPPKPLTAVSEGEEQAWSTVPVEEDKEEEMWKSTVPRSPKNRKKSVAGESTIIQEIIIEQQEEEPAAKSETASNVEEKEDYPAVVPAQNTNNTAIVVEDENSSSSLSSSRSSQAIGTSEEPTKVVVEAVPPPREPTPDPLQEGGYLIFSTVNDGTLHLCFSHHKVEEAIAYFRPKKIVPAFKYRQNHGKVELIRKLVNHKQGYYEGFADFVKAAKEFDSDIYLIQQAVKVYYQADSSMLYEAPFHKFFPSRISAVAVIPPGNDSFEGVKSLSPEQFVSTGNKFGKALKF